ncbi:hypothetical protein FRC01_002809 [Tulasnella sp. 417]|nr:hypothetical protein FRC01_002809 [Tulasnella sp. 417]
MASGLQERIQELINESFADFQPDSPAHVPSERIVRLDDELVRLQNAHKAISAEISARVTRVSACRNSLVPIHRLPPELFSFVLEESLGHFDATPEPRTTKRLLALATVSRRWKDILDQSPSVWGWIDTFSGAPFAVRKSRHSPLWINLADGEPLSMHQLEPGLRSILPHSKRWQTLRLRMTTDAAKHFFPVFGLLSTPRLQDLGFIADSVQHATLDHLSGYPLRRLTLSGVSTSWDTVASFTELRSLKIANLWSGEVWPSRDQIAEILLSCIHLEELALCTLETHPTDTSVPPEPQSTIHLPALRSLELSDILNTREATLWLLDCISTPNLSGLSVKGDLAQGPIGHPIASVLKRQRANSPFPVVMASLRSRPVHVGISQQWCYLHCDHLLNRGAHQGLDLRLPGRTYEETYQIFADIAPSIIGDPPLHLHLQKVSRNPDHDPAFLLQLPSLCVLRIGSGISNIEAFLRVLCSRRPGDPVDYCCPNLTEIHFLGAPWKGTEMHHEAINQVKEKRPYIALYDGEGQLFPRHVSDVCAV